MRHAVHRAPLCESGTEIRIVRADRCEPRSDDKWRRCALRPIDPSRIVGGEKESSELLARARFFLLFAGERQTGGIVPDRFRHAILAGALELFDPAYEIAEIAGTWYGTVACRRGFESRCRGWFNNVIFLRKPTEVERGNDGPFLLGLGWGSSSIVGLRLG